MLKLFNNYDILNLNCRNLAFKDTFNYYTSLWQQCQGLFLIGEKIIALTLSLSLKSVRLQRIKRVRLPFDNWIIRGFFILHSKKILSLAHKTQLSVIN